MTSMSKQHSPGFLRLVQDAKSRIRELAVQQVHEKLARGELFHLVDVREDREWEKGHLPGAIHLSKGIIERDVEQRLPEKQAPIICYCGGGFRSAMVADNLQKMGYTDVWSMDGGWSGWVEAGYPTEK